MRVTREIEGCTEKFSMTADHHEKSMAEVIDQLPVIIGVDDEDYRSVNDALRWIEFNPWDKSLSQVWNLQPVTGKSGDEDNRSTQLPVGERAPAKRSTLIWVKSAS